MKKKKNYIRCKAGFEVLECSWDPLLLFTFHSTESKASAAEFRVPIHKHVEHQTQLAIKV